MSTDTNLAAATATATAAAQAAFGSTAALTTNIQNSVIPPPGVGTNSFANARLNHNQN